MALFPCTRPFEQISVDIVGPLPITAKNGFRYIVTIIDKFTRFCKLVPVTNIKAITVLKAIDKWIDTFGPPSTILSDNGSQFTSAIYKAHMDRYGTKCKYSVPYHPECNGQIERLHRWMKERLALSAIDFNLDFVHGDDDWSDYL
eukprot:898055_1